MRIEDISSKPSNLTTRFGDFTRRLEIVYFELAVSKKCNLFLSERIIQLERNTVNNAQYYRRKLIGISSVPESFSGEELEDNVSKALPLTGHKVIPRDFNLAII